VIGDECESMNKSIVLTLMAVLGLAWASWADGSPTLVGKVIDIDGPRLMTNRLTESRWYQGYVQMPTFLAERIKADSETSATIQFYIGGRAVISPGTEVELVTMESLQVLRVKSGTVWAKFDSQEKELQIQTAGGVMGIEGTEFFVEADVEGETRLTVVEGRVRVRSGDEEKVFTDGEEADFQFGVKRFQKFADPSTATRGEIRAAAFKRLGIQDKPFARYILTRGLADRKKRRLLNRLFFKQAALRRPPLAQSQENGPRSPSRRLARRAQIARSSQFQVSSVDQSGDSLTAEWMTVPTNSYAVLLSHDEAGDNPIWHGVTNIPSLIYPDHGPELEAGVDYYLSVTPLRQNGQPFLNRQGETVSTQTPFTSQGHRPKYSTITDVRISTDQNLPKIEWTSLEPSGGHLVSILRGEETVWVGEADEAKYTYPLSARDLQPGKYQVLVESFDESGFKMAESPLVEFETRGWEPEGLEGPARE
jgi:FecR-like protein